MTGGRRAIGSGRRPLAGLLLLLAVWSTTTGETPGVAALLKPLDLRMYPSATTPPDFSGRTQDARQISMAELRGKVVVVNFWATWCLDCRPEMPALERLHRELAGRGLAIVGVNAREDGSKVARYATDLGLTFPLVLDPRGEINTLYGVVGLPATFVVARDGRAVAFAIGPREWAGPEGRALIEALLAEPSPPRQR